MKKKFLSLVLALCFMIPCALTLTACGGEDSDHTHDYEITWSTSSTHHWYACKGEDCSEKKDNATHTYNVDTCSICGYVNSDLTPATLQSMDTYFSGVKAEYLKDSFLGADNQTATFEELLDTQIDVLAQDLLYRLTYVYGAQNETTDNRTDNTLKTFEYSYNGATAKTKAEKMITNVTETFDSVTSIDLNNIESTKQEFQKSLTLVSGTNCLNSNSRLKLVGAIEGYNSAIIEEDGVYSFAKDENNAWEMSCGGSIYDNMAALYKDTFKLKIAQILGADSDATEYSIDILSDIKNLGYFENHKQAISKFILDEVIGTTQVTTDNGYYDLWIRDYNGLIDTTTITPINQATTIEEKAPRLYKGYSIVVPAIVEQALANTFEGTNISLYPKMSRTAYESITTTTGFATEKEYQTITLMPKADAVTTRLVVKLTGVGSSIGQTIALDYDVVINGTTYSGTKNVTLTSTEQEVEIDLKAITNGSTFGAYNGTTTSHTSGNAFSNNDFDTQGNSANSDGNNYIKLDFNNTNNYSFIVTFGGMYNK